MTWKLLELVPQCKWFKGKADRYGEHVIIFYYQQVTRQDQVVWILQHGGSQLLTAAQSYLLSRLFPTHNMH